ncbi:prephenate dehydratase domain-containing protein [Achromobacter spanius]|uniref:prephenate dehydratase n=1 Tax=Achromobacter spanius TaxID=217203 RepID=UPI003209EFFE
MKMTLQSAAAGLLTMMTMTMTPSVAGSIGYLGPAGSWTHQACLDLFGPEDLVALSRDELFASYASGKLDQACVPVTTSVVGVTPYIDAVLDLPNAVVVSEYPKMLGYSLLARPGTKLNDVQEVLAHPVAFEEVKPWLDREMPNVRRIESSSGGAAAKTVSESTTFDKASFGPRVGASVYSLESLVDGIEEGPHNVTRWWVLGRNMPAPSGHDKTSLVLTTSDENLNDSLRSLVLADVQVLTVYERPSKKTLDTHRYIVEVAGHARQEPLASLLKDHPDYRVLGSYPRRQEK